MSTSAKAGSRKTFPVRASRAETSAVLAQVPCAGNPRSNQYVHGGQRGPQKKKCLTLKKKQSKSRTHTQRTHNIHKERKKTHTPQKKTHTSKSKTQQRTRSSIHVLVPAPPHELSESPRPLLLEGRSASSLDNALHELLSVQALERPPQAEHLPQDQAEAVNVSLVIQDGGGAGGRAVGQEYDRTQRVKTGRKNS